MSPVWTRVRTPPAPQKSYVEHSLRRIFFIRFPYLLPFLLPVSARAALDQRSYDKKYYTYDRKVPYFQPLNTILMTAKLHTYFERKIH